MKSTLTLLILAAASLATTSCECPGGAIYLPVSVSYSPGYGYCGPSYGYGGYGYRGYAYPGYGYGRDYGCYRPSRPYCQPRPRCY
jgi:hypothetical protein